MNELLIKTAKRTGLIDAESLAEYFRENAEDPRRTDDLLFGAPNFTEDSVLKLFAEALDMEYYDSISTEDVPMEFIETVPASYAQQHFIIGITADADDPEITIVLSKPLDTSVIDNVSNMLGAPVRPALASRTTITAAIDVAYEQKSTVIDEVAEELDSQNLDKLVDEVSSSDDLLDVVNRPPVIRLVNDILFRALQLRASDIHIHPYETKIQIRYRIDGILYDTLSLNRNVVRFILRDPCCKQK